MKSSLLNHLNRKNKCYDYDKIFEATDSQVEKNKSKKENQDDNELTKRIQELETEIKSYKKMTDDDDFMNEINEMKKELKKVKEDLKTANEELEAKDNEMEEIIANRDEVIERFKNRLLQLKQTNKELTEQLKPVRNTPDNYLGKRITFI
jgi:chromosome segregation ATPase